MDVLGWEERYRQKSRACEAFDTEPTPLLLRTAKTLTPGKALDLACGTGRNSLWLAKAGWQVTAVDGSSAAIETLQTEAKRQQVIVHAKVADLHGDYRIEEANWDQIVIAYYLQRTLFEPAKKGIVPGGVLIAIVHTTEEGEEATDSRLWPEELKSYFTSWEITHSYEGKPNDPAHRRRVAEIVTRRPAPSSSMQ